ncbi:Two-component response regulator, FixJ family, consists of REC and HTH domains [Erythrobacter litoralis]|jgi:FixJ family two-component response regulator|uniref:LuxR family transcriptional regulator n=1 Tax=Erythrobacter litoralis TaxID=39960 RepID=A0A074MCK3_9SPHN|nr:LuxR C-terminal-related transcriptional regulator [Erythrobacter litoralis]AOL22289.1 Two-component response regulator, FixJ family, consists of REC and HTH domains [Erythrobacter litoralis]KEO89578.1 LuxR family transcriptional regulator [Erythrobacter litoralis]MEE4337387.1 LuxR C-terminal-related transcriptional regulator [Erythrobacter sp.]
MEQIKECSGARLVLHIVEAESRVRAMLARICFEMGYHAEVYTGVEEIKNFPPKSGVILARDNADRGGVSHLIDILAEMSVHLPVIAFDACPHPQRIVEAIKAGALDYLELPLERERVARCLLRVATEIDEFSLARRRMLEARARVASLSQREREVLDWLAKGLTNKGIARELNISHRTVEVHRFNMMNKLDVRHAVEAVRLMYDADQPASMSA